MTKNQILGLFLSTACIGFYSCSNDGFKRTSDGLEYKIVEDVEGDRHPAKGDIVKLHINIHVGDSTLMNSYTMNNNQPFEFPVMDGNFKGDWLDGLSLLSAGDSAVFLVPVDSIRKNAQGGLPPFVKDGDKMTYEVRLISVKSSKEMEDERKKANEQQLKTDDERLQAYFKENGLNPQKTESGLYYIIDKQGSGEQITEGKEVFVDYTGTSLEGVKFDSNTDPQFNHVEPFSFVTGRGMVIPGWDEGIQLLKKGSEARFFIPSTLAYGQRDMGPEIGKNAVLVFEVKVTDVKEAPSVATK